MTSMATQCILSHNVFWPTPSAMIDPLSSFVHSIYLFFFVKCSRIKSPFIPFLVPPFSLGFLHSWCKNYGHSLMVFLHPLGSKVIKNRRKEVTRPITFGFKYVWGKFDNIPSLLLLVLTLLHSLSVSSPFLRPSRQLFSLLSSSQLSLSLTHTFKEALTAGLV
jgi:hypothetical protein